ncbi:MAG: tRNA lysidine(34) synthetase TilS [Bacteroidetes bacterium]|nr:tRNA lysidine(34) synthetase TilS [Bacteroidota bacterium]
MSLLQRFQDNWQRKQFAAPQQTILLAVSGGIDSMAMADLFLKAKLSFAIAHCNFQLRGDEANKDEDLVREWAFNNNVAFHHVRFDTQQKVEEWKKGIQETARILRYEWLESIRQEFKYAFIATAHHANDNAETLLMNLFKGTGMAGMHGIPVKNDKIIRPLLFAAKKEISDYVNEHDINYREDASNKTDHYLRNEVRHHIVPAVEKVFPAAISRVSETIERLEGAELLYKKALEQERRKLVEQRGKDFYISVLKLAKREALATLVYELFIPYGFSPAQMPHIISLLQSESGHYVQSESHKVIRNRDFLIITTNQTEQTDIITIEGLPCTAKTVQGSFVFSYIDKPAAIPADANVALIDCKQISFPLFLRKWKQGDYFYPLGMGMKKKKVSKFFIDQKIPLHEKEQTWVLECNKKIVWVCGMRLDERFKVKSATEKLIRIEFKKP